MDTTTSKTHFLLFPTCIPVKGDHTSILMDLDRGSYIEIPNLLYDILTTQVVPKKNIEDIKSFYTHQYDEGIDQYFDFFTTNMYGFYTDNPSPFRVPDKEFHSPHKVISSIIAIDKNTTHDLKDVLDQLDLLSCQLLEMRFYDHYSHNGIAEILSTVRESSIRKIEIYIPYNAQDHEEELMDFVKNFPRVILIIYSAPENKKLKIEKKFVDNLIYTTQLLHKQSKEVISPKSFTITHQMYYEALQYNTGLYRKVCIDTNGDVKNYLSHDIIFGNVAKDSISSVINAKNFQKKYHISNDKIEKCKDCQYRYMCLSNSDTKLKNKKQHKMDLCRFDPYTNTWN